MAAAPVRSVLVVCTGNICRSPTGESVLRAKARARGLERQIRVASAGTHDYHVGERPDPRSVSHATKRGYDLSSQRAQLVAPEHFHQFDYILAMDRSHLSYLKSIAPGDGKARLGMFLETSRSWKSQDVPDPYYGNAEGFERVLDMIEEAAEGWIDVIAAELDPADFKLAPPR